MFRFRSILLLTTRALWVVHTSNISAKLRKLIAWWSRNEENEMASITLPLGIRVAMEYELNGKIVVNVYHVQTSDPITTIKLEEIAGAFVSWWTDHMSLAYSNDISLVSVVAKDISVLNGAVWTEVVSPAIPGDVATIAAPSQVAWVATLKTAKTGRSYTGRIYHAGLPYNNIDENLVNTAKTATQAANYVILSTELGAINTILVVASFVSGGVPRVQAVGTSVDSIVIKRRVDTQRRRLPKET